MNNQKTQTKNQLYSLVKHDYSKQEFEDKIKKIRKDFGDLIDEDAAAFLFIDKCGYNKANTVDLADIHPGQEATVQGRITSIQPVRMFTRKNGRQGKVANLFISDDTGSIPLVLWNDDARKVEQGTIKEHMDIKIINGYTKQGRNGVEIHVGRWSSININKHHKSIQQKSDHSMQNNNSSPSITGSLLSVTPTKVFFRNDGSYGFVSTVHLKTNTGLKRVTVWDDQVKNLQDFNQGDLIMFSYLDEKMNQGKKEYHANGKAVIKRI